MCYAEKTHGSYILPYISTTRSPQQVMGALVKDYFASSINRSAAEVYHVTVMPCFDKKLEASRADFYNDLHKTRDVDCVITSGKYGSKEMLLQLLFDHSGGISHSLHEGCCALQVAQVFKKLATRVCAGQKGNMSEVVMCVRACSRCSWS